MPRGRLSRFGLCGDFQAALGFGGDEFYLQGFMMTVGDGVAAADLDPDRSTELNIRCTSSNRSCGVCVEFLDSIVIGLKVPRHLTNAGSPLSGCNLYYRMNPIIHGSSR